MSRKHLLAYALTLCTISAASQLQAQTPAPAAKQVANKKAAASAQQQQHGEGQRVFEQNCSRCHTAPNGFSPRISGTVALHMRMRASLSKDDTQALLHFLNP